jgi:hypothetical protein
VRLMFNPRLVSRNISTSHVLHLPNSCGSSGRNSARVPTFQPRFRIMGLTMDAALRNIYRASPWLGRCLRCSYASKCASISLMSSCR